MEALNPHDEGLSAVVRFYGKLQQNISKLKSDPLFDEAFKKGSLALLSVLSQKQNLLGQPQTSIMVTTIQMLLRDFALSLASTATLPESIAPFHFVMPNSVEPSL